MQAALEGSHPFTVLTALVAPAILTNAMSVLALGTSNRLGRVVDRTRLVAKELAGCATGTAEHEAQSAQLATLRIRANMLVRALRLFYAALGLFAASAFISLLGWIASFYGANRLFDGLAALALITGGVAVGGLAVGCGVMIRETQLAVRSLAAEASFTPGP